MKFFKYVLLNGLLFTFLISCSTSCSHDMEEENSDLSSSQVNRIRSYDKVLILGNSIAEHAPKAEIDWYGDWGMAASAEEYDFVHVLQSHFSKYNSDIEFKVETISGFETAYWLFDTTSYTSLKAWKPDLIIVRLGDNVDDSLVNELPISGYMEYLIEYLKGGSDAKVCMTNSFWPKPNYNQQVLAVCIQNEYDHVSIADLYYSDGSLATATYGNTVVGLHPSDNGMKVIANRIWSKLTETK